MIKILNLKWQLCENIKIIKKKLQKDILQIGVFVKDVFVTKKVKKTPYHEYVIEDLTDE